MNDLENRTTNASELTELREICADLRRQTSRLLIGLILLSFTLAFFVGFQVRRTGKDLDAIRPRARQMMSATEKEEPSINAFVAKLVDYSKTHPDFAPIAAKYQLNATNVAAAKLNTTAP